MRSKLGKSTFGQYGDIAAVDPVGSPLTRALCIELKRGYTRFSFADAIDRRTKSAPTHWEAFVEQASTSATASGALAWLLVQRRDKRRALVFFPRSLFVRLQEVGAFEVRPAPFVQMRVAVRRKKGTSVVTVVCVTLDQFLFEVLPDHIRALG